jgi:hypothetical protein
MSRNHTSLGRRGRAGLGFLLILAAVGLGTAAGDALPDRSQQYRQWVDHMKSDPRGPFSAIRWYCRDGSVLPPSPTACADHGGGWQHGEWSERAKTLRSQGYKIANVLAGTDAADWVAAADFPDTFAQLLVEKFLIAADNGWIFRGAQFYRGAVQEEDERDAARKLLTALAGRPEWIGYRYPVLRIGARLLPHGEDKGSAQKVRQLATTLSDLDPGFAPLRAKIHATLEASDAARVRDHARPLKDPALRARHEDLATQIARVFQPPPLGDTLEANAAIFSAGPWLQKLLRDARAEYLKEPGALNRYRVTAELLADLRDALPRIKSPSARLRVLDLSLAVEAEHFRAGAELRAGLSGEPRQTAIAILRAAAQAAYGTGMLNRRLLTETAQSFRQLAADPVALGDYRRELRVLGLAPGWGTQGLRLHFFEAMEKIAEIEPLAELFIQDQLRASPLLLYSQVLDVLTRDGNRLADTHHTLFGQDIGVGFNALNPGLARGVLQAHPDMKRVEDFHPDGIYVLPETVADLPPVGGILTRGAGNPLSHVQLLARNLGIPNVAVDETLIPALREKDGQRIVLAVSPAGGIEIAEDGRRWDAVFGDDARVGKANVLIEPDLQKLDLSRVDVVSLDRLRATDSGRIVGPKAAKLGELRQRFPEAVVRGVAIPFGLFRRTVLDRPHRGSGRTVGEWMAGQFHTLASLAADSPAQRTFAETFRAELYDVIRHTEPGPEFRQKLQAALAQEFGPDFKGGLFVRSDTNVEDLPGFTGAGLNRTLPNIVGFDHLMQAIAEVWASPYTARAFAWRQNHLRGLEHVYPAVLLMPTVPAEKSGVMVTQDLDTGDRSVLAVAVNEGIGGAVDGQAAESLRIDTRTGAVRVLATATAPWRMLPRPEGGMEKRPVTGSETLLQPEEIRQLIAFAAEIPRRFPPIVDGDGRPAAADVEFAFVGGKLWLLQIRPFNESRRSRTNAYLLQMDALSGQDPDPIVSMRAVPK